jgi:hypothetical protein
MIGGDEAVMDARKLLDSFEGLAIPEDAPKALETYSK